MTDIVDRLQMLQSGAAWFCEETSATLEDAVAEIERLRAERDRLRAEVEAARRDALEEAAGIVERVAIRGTAPLAAAIRARGDA